MPYGFHYKVLVAKHSTKLMWDLDPRKSIIKGVETYNIYQLVRKHIYKHL